MCTSMSCYIPHSLLMSARTHIAHTLHTHTHTQMSQNHAPGTPPASMATGMATSNHPVGYRTLPSQQQQYSSLPGHPAGAGAPQQPGGNSSMTPSTSAPVHHRPPSPSVCYIASSSLSLSLSLFYSLSPSCLTFSLFPPTG